LAAEVPKKVMRMVGCTLLFLLPFPALRVIPLLARGGKARGN
jgi:hypothetical protein